jgi:hypothetical protein
VWENKVVERILHNMSLLMERSFASVQELNRYRKELSLLLQAFGRGGAFFHQRRVLLRHLVHLAHRLADLADAGALLALAR